MSSKITPILHYDFEHLTPDGKVQDMSGNGYDGTIHGATLTEDMWGNPNSAYEFDDISNRILTPLYPSDLPDTFSICDLSTIKAENTEAVFLWTADAGGEDRFYLQPYTASNVQRYRIGLYSWNEDIHVPYIGTHCTVITYDNGVGRFYYDGIPQNEITNVVRVNSTQSIGIRNLYAVLSVCEDFRIYDQALTPTQVKKISFDMMRKVGRN